MENAVTTTFSKIFSKTTANQSQILHEASIGRWNHHMTKMAAMPIYGKNPSEIFSGTAEPIATKHGM